MNEIHGYTILRRFIDYLKFIENNHPFTGYEPLTYPCLVKIVDTQNPHQDFDYIFLQELKEMLEALSE